MKLPTNKAEAGLLRRALLGNAAFSAICGVLIFAFAELQWLGLRRLRSSTQNP